MGNTEKTVFKSSQVKKYRKIISKTKKSIFAVDFGGNLVSCTKQMTEIFGNEFINESIWKFIPKFQSHVSMESRNFAEFLLEKLKQTKSIITINFLWIINDKDRIWSTLDISLQPIGKEKQIVQCIYTSCSKPEEMSQLLKNEIENYKKEKFTNPNQIKYYTKRIQQLKFEKNRLAQKDQTGVITESIKDIKTKIQKTISEKEHLQHQIDSTFQLIEQEEAKLHSKEFNQKVIQLKSEKQKLKFEIKKFAAESLLDQNKLAIQKIKERIDDQLICNTDLKYRLQTEQKLNEYNMNIIQKNVNKDDFDQILEILNQQLDLVKKVLEEEKKKKKIEDLRQQIILEKKKFRFLSEQKEDFVLYSTDILSNISISRSSTQDFETTSHISDEPSEKSLSFDYEKEDKEFNTLQDILKDKFSVQFFIEFLVQDFRFESFLFYLAVSQFEEEENEDHQVLFKKADQIYKKFIKSDSLFELNIPLERRTEIRQKILQNEFDNQLFTKEKQMVHQILIEKLFPEFKNSALFQSLKTYYGERNKFLSYNTGILTFERKKSNVLNLITHYQENLRSPMKISENLTEMVINICSSRYSISTEQIELTSLAESLTFMKFLLSSRKLQKAKIKKLQPEQKIPFFVNMYNVLLFHIAVLNLAPKSHGLEQNDFFHYKYNIGGFEMSLNDIKNGILRKNEKMLACVKSAEFGKELVVPKFDPKIHFAMLTLDSHTPILRVLYQDTYEVELENMTQEFIRSRVIFSTKTKKIVLPKLFQEFDVDFGGNWKSVVSWVTRYLEQNDQVKEMVSNLDSYEVRYVAPKKSPLFIFDSSMTSVDLTDSDRSEESQIKEI